MTQRYFNNSDRADETESIVALGASIAAHFGLLLLLLALLRLCLSMSDLFIPRQPLPLPPVPKLGTGETTTFDLVGVLMRPLDEYDEHDE